MKSRSAVGLVSIGIFVGCTAGPPENDAAQARDELQIGNVGSQGALGRLPAVAADTVDREFFVHTLGKRCLDFGGEGSWRVGAPVFIYTCNGSVAQRVRVREIDDGSHDVELHTPYRLGGPDFCIGVRGGRVTPGAALELQKCNFATRGDAPPDLPACEAPPCRQHLASQRFALDGDSIMMGAQADDLRVSRELVLRLQGGVTLNRTPLVVGGERDASDVEYLRFRAADGSDAFPTSGFVRIAPSTLPHTKSDHWLRWASEKGWGTVIEIDPTRDFVITEPQAISAGVTLRGSRLRRDRGPTIKFAAQGQAAIWITGDRARVTGLRFDGPDERQVINLYTGKPLRAPSGAISVRPEEPGEAPRHVTIDHVEITHWGAAAIDIIGNDESHAAVCDLEPSPRYAYPRALNIRALRNYIHENQRKGGYGIAVGNGAIALAQGNVMFKNAHSITADPWRHSSYVAYDNLLTEETFPSEHSSNQDFDVHGTGGAGDNGSFDGGNAGESFDIGWNTFLGDDHYALNLRGNPCGFLLFHHNISVQRIGDAIRNNSGGPLQGYPPTTDPPLRQVFFWENRFAEVTPMDMIGSGDFDGDGRLDDFVGTGNTWWYSSNRQSEWRLLNRMPEYAPMVRFADIDGDGLTDVLAYRDGDEVVSWAGRTPWQKTGFTGGGPRPPGRL